MNAKELKESLEAQLVTQFGAKIKATCVRACKLPTQLRSATMRKGELALIGAESFAVGAASYQVNDSGYTELTIRLIPVLREDYIYVILSGQNLKYFAFAFEGEKHLTTYDGLLEILRAQDQGKGMTYGSVIDAYVRKEENKVLQEAIRQNDRYGSW